MNGKNKIYGIAIALVIMGSAISLTLLLMPYQPGYVTPDHEKYIFYTIESSDVENVSLALPQVDFFLTPAGYKHFELPTYQGYSNIAYHQNKVVEVWFKEKYWSPQNDSWVYPPLHGPFFIHLDQFGNMEPIQLDRTSVNITVFLAVSDWTWGEPI